MAGSLVVAVGRGGVIGRRGALPWHAPEDLAHFKAITMGHHLVVGRLTWESIGRPLPGRRMVVVSRQPLDLPDGVERAPSPRGAFDLARRTDPDPCVIGGAQVYDALVDLVDVVHLTDVDVDVPDGDTFFHLDPERWHLAASRPGDDARLTFRRFERTGPQGASGDAGGSPASR